MSSDPGRVERLGNLMERLRTEAEEHRRRMDTDPAYRAEQERKDREREEAIQAEYRRSDAESRRQHLAALRDEANMPPRVIPLLDAGLDSEAATAVQKFIDSEQTFLVLAGKVGCGKTAAACQMLDKLGGRFVKAAAVTRARFDDEAWDDLLRARSLVVDDLGTETMDGKGWSAGALAELFDHRYDWQAKTILTTNLDPEAFKARYCEQDGGRFLSRLREAGQFVVVSQDSLRGRAS